MSVRNILVDNYHMYKLYSCDYLESWNWAEISTPALVFLLCPIGYLWAFNVIHEDGVREIYTNVQIPH